MLTLGEVVLFLQLLVGLRSFYNNFFFFFLSAKPEKILHRVFASYLLCKRPPRELQENASG